MEASNMDKIKTFMYIHIYFTEFRVDKNINLFTYIHIYLTEDGVYHSNFSFFSAGCIVSYKG